MASIPAQANLRTGLDPTVSGADSPFQGMHIYFIGIGGCGVSGLAMTLRSLGAICRGSDSVTGGFVESLIEKGIDVSLDQSKGELPEELGTAPETHANKRRLKTPRLG